MHSRSFGTSFQCDTLLHHSSQPAYLVAMTSIALLLKSANACKTLISLARQSHRSISGTKPQTSSKQLATPQTHVTDTTTSQGNSTWTPLIHASRVGTDSGTQSLLRTAQSSCSASLEESPVAEHRPVPHPHLWPPLQLCKHHMHGRERSVSGSDEQWRLLVPDQHLRSVTSISFCTW